jgi:hypothetical protein
VTEAEDVDAAAKVALQAILPVDAPFRSLVESSSVTAKATHERAPRRRAYHHGDLRRVLVATARRQARIPRRGSRCSAQRT